MKKFEPASLEVVEFNTQDIITSSSCPSDCEEMPLPCDDSCDDGFPICPDTPYCYEGW